MVGEEDGPPPFTIHRCRLIHSLSIPTSQSEEYDDIKTTPFRNPHISYDYLKRKTRYTYIYI